MNRLHLRLIQMDIRPSKEENLDFIENAINSKWKPQNIDDSSSDSDEEKKQPHGGVCEVLALPELFTTGYYKREKMVDLAENMNGFTATFLKRIVREKGISIGAGSFAEDDSNTLCSR